MQTVDGTASAVFPAHRRGTHSASHCAAPPFSLLDLVRVDPRAAAPLAAVSVPEIYHRLDHLDAETFLEQINFPLAARHLAFEVFSRSFFTEPGSCRLRSWRRCSTSTSSAPARACSSTWPTPISTSLWLPLREFLTAEGLRPARRNVRFHTGIDISTVDTAGPPFRVHHTTVTSMDADGVVLATDVTGLRRIVGGLTHPRRHRVAMHGSGSWTLPRIPRTSALARPARRRRPAGVPRHRRSPATRQHQRRGPLRDASP